MKKKFPEFVLIIHGVKWELARVKKKLFVCFVYCVRIEFYFSCCKRALSQIFSESFHTFPFLFLLQHTAQAEWLTHLTSLKTPLKMFYCHSHLSTVSRNIILQ